MSTLKLIARPIWNRLTKEQKRRVRRILATAFVWLEGEPALLKGGVLPESTLDSTIADVVAKKGSEAAKRSISKTLRWLSRHRQYPDIILLVDALERASFNSNDFRFMRAAAFLRGDRWREALDPLRTLFESGWETHRVAPEYASALERMIARTTHHPNTDLSGELLKLARRTLGGEIDASLSPSVGLVLARSGFVADAESIIDRFIERNPGDKRGYIGKSRFLVEQSKFGEAAKLLQDVVRRWPDDHSAALSLKVIGGLSGRADDSRLGEVAVLEQTSSGFRIKRPGASSVELGGRDWFVRFRELGYDSLRILVGTPGPELASNGALGNSRSAGCLRLSNGDSLWQGQVIFGLAEAGLVPDARSLQGSLSRFEDFFVPNKILRSGHHRGNALLISRWGATGFGGAEHTLSQFADLYAARGFTPIIAGTRGEIESNRASPYLRRVLGESPHELRRYILENDITLVHAVSGIGLEVASAMNLMNIPLVYGIHYWREVLGHSTGERFFDDQGRPIPRSEFSFLASQATAIYVNSNYTRDVVEAAHGVRYPVIYSVPKEFSDIV